MPPLSRYVIKNFLIYHKYISFNNNMGKKGTKIRRLYPGGW
jgi:hypothetical protein